MKNGIRALCYFLAALIAAGICMLGIPSSVAADTTEIETASRMLNIVYDDSRSMHWYNHKWWAYAKYSLEIFSAMMQDKDTMNIYYMSDYAYGRSNSPRITGMSGTRSKQQENIDRIHNTVTATNNTPFSTIRAAFEDLKKAPSTYTERWLVVITDGAYFDNDETSADLDALFASAKTYDIKVVYLAIGSNLIPTAKDSEGIFVYRANGNSAYESDGILSNVTNICERIFQRPKLNKVGANNFTIDIPVSEIIILAQGNNVEVGSIPNTKKTTAVSSMKASEAPKIATTNTEDYGQLAGDDLSGTIITFTPSNGRFIEEGRYNLTIKADEYSIYYKPRLEVALRLFDSGNNLVNATYIPIGSYKVDYWLTYPEGHSKYGEKISQSLFAVDYVLSCTTSSGTKRLESKSIDLKEGAVTLRVDAKYLNYISDSAVSKFVVEDFTISRLEIELEYPEDVYKLSKLEKDEYGITVKVRRKNGTISLDEWDNFVINVTGDRIDFKTVKGDVGLFTIFPRYFNGDRKNTSTGEVPFNVQVSASNDHRQTDVGNKDGMIYIEDDVSSGDIGIVIHEQDFKVDNKNFTEQAPARKITLTWKGNRITKEQYDALKIDVETKSKYLTAYAELDPYEDGKDVTATVFFNTVKDEYGGEPDPKKLNGKQDFTVKASMDNEGELSTGEAEDTLEVDDARTLWEKLLDFLPALIVIASILYLILAYATKKYLPKMIYYMSDIIHTVKPYKRPEALISAALPIPFIGVKSKVVFKTEDRRYSVLLTACKKKNRAKINTKQAGVSPDPYSDSKVQTFSLRSATLFRNGTDQELLTFVERGNSRKKKKRR